MFPSFYIKLKMLGSIGKKNDKISFVSFGKLHIDCLTEKVPSKAVCSKDF